MEPDALVSMVKELEAEMSGDVMLFEALARRFHANADEFFPPQIDAVLGCFARLGYADEALLRGFAGRLGDLASDASARRVVRLLRNGSALQLRPDAWLEGLLPQLCEQLPNMRAGVPSALGSLHALRWRDGEMVELLLTQGLIVAEDLDIEFFARLYERWSRFGLEKADLEQRVFEMAESGQTKDLDLRDCLNLLVGLSRCPNPKARGARDRIEAHLEARLKGTAGAGGKAPQGATAAEAATCLEWMSRLSLRSEKLWLACADAVQLAMQDLAFARERLPNAVHDLASLTGGKAGELALVAALLAAPETSKVAHLHNAWQLTQLLRAGCLVKFLAADGLEISLEGFLASAMRMSRQLSLPQRRLLREAVEVLPGLGVPGAPEAVASVRALPISALPPLLGDPAQREEEDTFVEVGGHAVQVASEADQRGFRYVAMRDTFAGSVRTGQAEVQSASLTPSCRLTLRALVAQGWRVEMRA